MPLNRAKLDCVVSIEQPNLIDNGRGGRAAPRGGPAWTLFEAAYAECLPLRGGEAMSNLVQRSKQLWRVTVDAIPGINTSMRLRWDDPLMGEIIANIRSAVVNEERDGIIITAESGVPT